MNVKKLISWEEFEKELHKLENQRIEQKCSSKFLYRGQRTCYLELLTTLERNCQHKLDLLDLMQYHSLIFAIKPCIESFSGNNWNVLCPENFGKFLDENYPNEFGSSSDFQTTYEYMTYLRHYGFPSPLLDWTSSPYVASYFAFKDALPEECVSIYVFLESASQHGTKVGGSNNIPKLGPRVKTDPRHTIQQSQYTICTIFNDNKWQYAPHEKVFDRGKSGQDILWKFNIPGTEKLKVLRLLGGYNINALSLFGTKESLMETVTLREIYFKMAR